MSRNTIQFCDNVAVIENSKATIAKNINIGINTKYWNIGKLQQECRREVDGRCPNDISRSVSPAYKGVSEENVRLGGL